MLRIAAVGLLLTFSSGSNPSCREHRGATITNNGYTDIRVRIDSTVAEDPALIHNIKDAFTAASSQLYQSLKYRAYFETVRIILPSTWSKSASYGDATAKDLDPQATDFLVASKNPVYGDVPFVERAYPECGAEGEHVHVTPSYLNSWSAKEIVQKFAEQRFGIFPEYFNEFTQPNIYSNYPFATQNCKATVDPTPTSCPRFVPSGQGDQYELNGKACHPCAGTPSFNDPNTPPPDSHHYVHTYNDEQTTSLLYTAAENEVTQFCDENSHNQVVPNEQNSRCSLLSAWSVIDENIDFNGACTGTEEDASAWSVIDENIDFNGACTGTEDPNPPNPNIPSTVPTFTVVRNNDPRALTFVLDTSGSMGSGSGNPSRIHVLNQAVTAAVECMNQGEKVGIVSFSDPYAIKTRIALTEIGGENDRATIESHVPTSANGGTDIGDALIRGLQVLKAGLTSTKGAHLVVVSDGQENEGTCICSPTVQSQLEAADLVIDTIRISNKAAPVLTALANKFGGSPFFINTQSASWQDAMQVAVSQLCQLTRPKDRPGETVEVLSTTTTAASGQVHIDGMVGQNTVFLFLTTEYGRSVSVILTDPDGNTYDKNSPYYKTLNRGSLVSIRLPQAKSGTWYYAISRSVFQEAFDASAGTEEGPSSYSSNLNCRPYLQHCGAAPIPFVSRARPSQADQKILSTLPVDQNRLSTGAVAISVTSKSTDPQNPLMVKTFYSNTNITNVTSQQLLVFSKVTVGQSPVLKAAAMVTITDPAGHSHPVILLDNGRGVDEEAGDGIYSAYFDDFSSITTYKQPQPFQATTLVTGDENTVYVDPKTSTPVKIGQFRRSMNNPTFYVTLQDKSQKTVDTIPPGRVADFAARQVDYNNGTVHFRWTATGNDYSAGTASQYILKASSSLKDMVNHFDTLPAIDPSKIKGGQQMTIVLSPYKSTDFIYFALVATDGSGNVSPLSSVAVVNFTKPGGGERDPSRSLVFVLDTSASMGSDTQSRISVLQQLVTDAVGCLDSGASVGIAVFADYAYGTLALTTIQDDFSKATVKRHIPNYAVGNTDMGGGINSAIQLLKAGLKNTTFSRLVVISDGGEDTGTCACDKQIQEELRWANVTVDTVSINPSGSTSTMSALAKKRGGTSYYINADSSDWYTMMLNVVNGICDVVNKGGKVPVPSASVVRASDPPIYDNEDKQLDCSSVIENCN